MSPPGGKTARAVRRPEERTAPLTPASQSPKPQKMVKEPVGQPDKTGLKPIPLALTIGSASSAGQIPMTVMARPHLPQGIPGDVIDPPQPPAKGVPKSPSLLPAHKAVPPEKTASAAKPIHPEKTQPVKRETPRPAVVHLARNSQGIRNGALQPLPATPMPDSNTLVGDGSGLKGEYYEGRSFDTLAFTRADPNVAYRWVTTPTHSPGPKIQAYTDYTIRWTGRIVARQSETYTFYAAADDGVRIWINHKLVIDEWSANSLTQFSNKFTFRAGEQYLFKCEYLEVDGGDAAVFLYWSSPHTPKQYVPEDAFFYPLPDDEEELKLDKASY
ncbi:hypothetical protein CCAX7_38640 [Capsulimonas corticalis]|uniref:Uncharacterized protein n=1 Tax=Capsulimonas corticalis TaxID=2219043 RepID=A0A402D3T5_9BACT|nr:hypothetical protein CCAX7_38640 [Capsulimonas corticalis]